MHKSQGAEPSKVLSTAWLTDSVATRDTNMLAQATTCIPAE